MYLLILYVELNLWPWDETCCLVLMYDLFDDSLYFVHQYPAEEFIVLFFSGVLESGSKFLGVSLGVFLLLISLSGFSSIGVRAFLKFFKFFFRIQQGIHLNLCLLGRLFLVGRYCFNFIDCYCIFGAFKFLFTVGISHLPKNLSSFLS